MPRLFLSALHRMYREIGLHLERHAAAPNQLATGEAHLLSYLRRYGPCTAGRIGRVFAIKPSTLTDTLDRLEARELLHRRPNPADRRSFLIELTEPGQRLAAEIDEVLDRLESEVAEQAGMDAVEGLLETSRAVSMLVRSTRTPGRID